jgi:citrate synthase
MSNKNDVQPIHTRIWLEEPEPDNPFGTRAAYLRGYDVYGEMLGRASWAQTLYLLFRNDRPTAAQSKLFEALAVMLANPGARDAAVHAAMCGGVGGSTAASCLMAALAVGAGYVNGARGVFSMMRAWSECGNDLEAWQRWIITETSAPASDVWPALEHAPGFEAHAPTTSTIVRQSLTRLAELSPKSHLRWLAANREALENVADRPLALSGVAATAFADLEFTPEQGEMLHLLLRLPGAAAHALEQREYGFKNFPFYTLELEDDPDAHAHGSD